VTESEEPRIRVTDRRLIDPETGEARRPATPTGDPASETVAASFVAATVEAEFTEVEGKVAELTADLQRVHAEYANYRKRVDRDREVERERAVGGVLGDLLPVLDDVERARQHGELEGAFRTVGEALEAALARIGLARFGAVGDPFDPNVHEALTTESRDEVAEPTVVTVYQPGYLYAGRVLRAARVAVAGTD
jgi:molecular chaperone GrpE